MLSPPLSGTPGGAIETVEHAACDGGACDGGACDGGACGRAADVVSPFASGLPSARRTSKARVLCTWKSCDHQEADIDEMKKHAATHRCCPKEDCGWANAGDQKAKDRHVWSKHKVWAQSTMYPPISAQCDTCLRIFAREDGVRRHKKEVHGVTKRVRKSGG